MEGLGIRYEIVMKPDDRRGAIVILNKAMNQAHKHILKSTLCKVIPSDPTNEYMLIVRNKLTHLVQNQEVTETTPAFLIR